MKNSIHNLELDKLLENMVKNFIKEKLELLMKEELTNFLEVEHPEQPNSRNGSYPRSLHTRFGEIENMKVPRDRAGEFQTQVFKPYQRRDGWLEEAVIQMYQSGMSTRDVGNFIEKVIGTKYSAGTISNITEAVLEDIQAWHRRPLARRYSVLFLDGMYMNVRRDTVDKEVVYLAMGINEEGKKEILGFYIGGRESSLGWQGVLNDLYKRGLQQVLLGVFDGLSGLEEAFRSVYPKADVQRCIVHKMRNTLSSVRKKDQTEIAQDLKLIYRSPNKKLAEEQFGNFKQKWEKKYLKEIGSWEKDLPVLLTFMDYPAVIHQHIYTTNWSERMNKEIRKRIKTMNSLPSMEAAEKIIYLTIQRYNETWDKRIVTGFKQSAPVLKEMFNQRYMD